MAYKDAFSKLAERYLLPPNYLKQGLQKGTTRENLFKHLFDQRKLPDEGWDEGTIEILLREFAAMDSNNFTEKGGVGEREGRCFSGLVARRHFSMTHGIGRSGDLSESQPKAIGSTGISNLTNALVLDWLKTFVSNKTKDAFILPLCTGMSFTLILQVLKKERPEAKYVLWCRIDQKSCFKAIITSGLVPIIIDPLLQGEELLTDVAKIKRKINELGERNILCVITTTSCFAPRGCDSVEAVAQLTEPTPIFHVVNNAYGVQSTKCVHEIDMGARSGKIDIYIQSTDKNLMVPVGGAVIAGFDRTLLDKIRKNYPGRASFSQTLDVFITLLSMGKKGYASLLEKRTENFTYLSQKLGDFSKTYGEHVITSLRNNISIGMSLKSLSQDDGRATQLGSMLFSRSVQGARVVVPKQGLIIDSYEFHGWGSHYPTYPFPYLTAAASLGMDRQEVDFFIKKLEDCFKQLKIPVINENGKFF